MRLPVLSSCLLCFSVDVGLKIMAHINLILYILGLNAIIWALVSYELYYADFVTTIYHGVWFRTYGAFTATLYALEIIFGVLLIIGAHMKYITILRLYFWYGVTSTLAALLLSLLAADRAYVAFFTRSDSNIELICYTIVGLAIQFYFMLLIWSEIKNLSDEEMDSFEKSILVISPENDEYQRLLP